MIDIKETIIKIEGINGDEAEDIKRCLTVLYAVREGEQPLDRQLGLKQDFLDQPVNLAKNTLALEIIEKTALYEKRVAVKKVDYAAGTEGQLIPVIYLERRQE